MSRIFLSHSRRDPDLAPWFDTVFAREKVDAVRFEFEFEALEENPIGNISQRLESSVALFVLLSPHVIGPTLHTGNWVSAEVGLARGLGKPIWVFERLDKPVHFPVPFVDHYVRMPSGMPELDIGIFQFVRGVIKDYGSARQPTEPWQGAGHLYCSNKGCLNVFQIHQDNHQIDRCPACCTPGQWDMAAMLCRNCKGKGTVFTLIPLRSACGNCAGYGALLVDMASERCRTCGGQGRKYVVVQNVRQQVICEQCRGTGYEHWTYLRP